MSVQSQENIVKLQVTVDNTVLVEILERQTDFSGVESVIVSSIPHNIKTQDLLSALGAELAALNVQHQVTTTDILHDEVDSGLSLETSMKVGQERMSLLVGDQEDTLF